MKSKRILSLLAALALATTVLVGCGSKEEASNDTAKNEVAQESGLKDGTYTAKNEKNTASIEIEVKDGKIATVKYREVTPDGVDKFEDAEYNAKMKAECGTSSQETFPALEAALVEKQDVAAVDVVTGATGTTDRFKTLAEQALADAK